MSILTGAAIHEAVKAGDITISPFVEEQLNPVSYDLTLGEDILIYDLQPNEVLDSKKEPKTIHGSTSGTPLSHMIERGMARKQGTILRPGIGYLMHTVERISTLKYVPVLDGKSSIGRLFIKVHETAGYGDPGFDGQYTLEVTVVHPVRIYAGMRIAQMRFHTTHGELTNLYHGNYTGEHSSGPVASRAWKQFK